MMPELIPENLFGSLLLGRRSAPRVQLGVPAKLVSVFGTQDCMLIDLSRNGALVRLARPLAVDACGYLRAGPFEVFTITVRVKKSVEGDATSGVKFDTPLPREQLVGMRGYANEYKLTEKRLARLAAHSWVRGEGR